MTVYVLLSIGYINDGEHRFPETSVVNVYSSREKAEEYIAAQGVMTIDDSYDETYQKEHPNTWFYDEHNYQIQEEEVL